MAFETSVRRYSAFYLNWCQAFGEHDSDYAEGADLNWLFVDAAVGLIAAAEVKRLFFHELLGKHHPNPTIEFSENCSYIQLNETRHTVSSERNQAGMNKLMELLRRRGDLHMFLSYHIYYPDGTRIITFSRKKPMPLFYKEVAPLTARIV